MFASRSHDLPALGEMNTGLVRGASIRTLLDILTEMFQNLQDFMGNSLANCEYRTFREGACRDGTGAIHNVIRAVNPVDGCILFELPLTPRGFDLTQLGRPLRLNDYLFGTRSKATTTEVSGGFGTGLNELILGLLLHAFGLTIFNAAYADDGVALKTTFPFRRAPNLSERTLHVVTEQICDEGAERWTPRTDFEDWYLGFPRMTLPCGA